MLYIYIYHISFILYICINIIYIIYYIIYYIVYICIYIWIYSYKWHMLECCCSSFLACVYVLVRTQSKQPLCGEMSNLPFRQSSRRYRPSRRSTLSSAKEKRAGTNRVTCGSVPLKGGQKVPLYPYIHIYIYIQIYYMM